ncbi:kinase-like protein [Tothia fuscella]|uniref:Autophagy-related protein 1 n=1 Tax=Tothia fuscella TaxID=1048955 RepID=A0A9P4NGJ2_9PEZI|nr:kinase-like protein [Tothia fuscella]
MSPQPPIHIKEFRSSEEPYQILPGRTLGTGRWSNVLLATPSQSSSSIVPHHDDGFLTPPASPTTPKTVGQLASEKRPEFYAIKTAANRACIAALRHEATILTYLSTKRDHHMHIVTFHGYDESQNGLVFTAMPTSLETVITNNLASQNESNRTSTLATILPPMIKSLVSSLAWLHNTGIVHGDIKPGNILLKSTGPFDQNADILKGPFQQLLADFTSSFGLVDTIMYDPSTYAVHGGGTYEYLAPELLSKPYPPPAKPADVYAMAITILTVIIGASPFSCAAGNRFRLLDMIKAGQPLEYAQRDHLSADRIFDVAMAVKRSSGMDVLRMLKKALRKDPAERLSAKDWYGEF